MAVRISPIASKEPVNMDIVTIAIGVVFFALCLGYVRACANL